MIAAMISRRGQGEFRGACRRGLLRALLRLLDPPPFGRLVDVVT
jgi:hypothetical protein